MRSKIPRHWCQAAAVTILIFIHFHTTRRTSGRSLGTFQMMLSSLHKTITTPLLLLPPPPFFFSWVRSQISPCEICDRPRGTGTGFFPLFPWQYHSTNAPYSFSEWQTGGAWGPSKKQCLFGNLGALDRKAISLLFAFEGISCYSQQFFPYNRSGRRVPCGSRTCPAPWWHRTWRGILVWGLSSICGCFVPIRMVTGPPRAGRELNSVATPRTEF